MWQILLGIYLIVVVLVTVLLWSSLILAKRSDHNDHAHEQPRIDLTISDGFSSIHKRVLQLPALKELSKK